MAVLKFKPIANSHTTIDPSKDYSSLSSAERRQFAKNIQDYVASAWNRCADANNWKNLILSEAGIEILMGKINTMSNLYSKIRDGATYAEATKLHDDKIFETQRLFMSWLMSTTHLAHHAEPQYGKTGIISAVDVLIQAFSAKENMLEHTDIEQWSIIVNAAQNIPFKQIYETYNHIFDILSGFKFSNCDFSIDGLVCENMRNQNQIDLIRKGINRSLVTTKTDRKYILKCLKAIKLYQKKFNKTPEITLIVDEADANARAHGVFDVWTDEFAKAGVKIRLILSSATGYVYGHLENFMHLFAKIGLDSGYYGMFQGGRYPVYGYSEFADLTKIIDLKSFKLKNQEISAEGVKTVCNVICAISKGIKDVPKDYRFPHARLNGKPFNGGNGMIVRVGKISSANSVMNSIARSKKLDGIDFVALYDKNLTKREVVVRGEKIKFETVNDLVQKMKDKGVEKYVFFVCGTGRRSIEFPSDCVVGLDFTNKFSGAVAAFQGTAGRLCGYNKVNENQSAFILVSDVNADDFRLARHIFDLTQRAGGDPNYDQALTVYSKIDDQTMTLGDGVKFYKNAHDLRVTFDAALSSLPIFSALKDRIEKSLSHLITRTINNKGEIYHFDYSNLQKTKVCHPDALKRRVAPHVDLFGHILGDDIQDIEEYFDVKILRVNEDQCVTKANGTFGCIRRFDSDGSNFVKVSAGKYDRNGGNGTRSPSIRSTKNGDESIPLPHFLWQLDEESGVFSIMELTLPLKERTTYAKFGGNVTDLRMPTIKSGFHRYKTQREIDQIEAAKAL